MRFWRAQHPIKKTISYLEEALLHLKSGGVDPLRQASGLPPTIFQVLQRNLDLGLPLAKGIENFIGISRMMSRNMSQSRRLRTLILSRWAFVVMIGLLVRLFFVVESFSLDHSDPRSQGAKDFFSHFFSLDFQGGLLLAVWGLGAMLMLEPKNWLWNSRELNQLAPRWLESFIEGNAQRGDPWYQKMEAYRSQEFLFGVNLLAEKQETLLEYARQKSDEFQKKQQFVEELVPLWELLTLAPVMFILMALPATLWVLGL